MDKKYQVFVSSTYEDLIDERAQVIQALLELDCIPSGMELFSAADQAQWTLIKKVINDCDYYVVIVGGRYGSLASSGTSYTEREYRYALKQHKPILRFLHKDPDSLPVSRSERSEENRAKLERFREELERKLCGYWITPQDLGSSVKSSLIKLMKDKPAVGWVRGVASESITNHPDESESILKQLSGIRALLLSHHGETVRKKRVGGEVSSKTLFISCSFRHEAIMKVCISSAKQRGFKVLTGTSLGPTTTTRDGVIQLMKSCTHVLGVWSEEGGAHFQGNWIPSSWLLWELGAANALGLSWRLLISSKISSESWKRIVAESPHTFFSTADFKEKLKVALERFVE